MLAPFLRATARTSSLLASGLLRNSILVPVESLLSLHDSFDTPLSKRHCLCLRACGQPVRSCRSPNSGQCLCVRRGQSQVPCTRDCLRESQGGEGRDKPPGLSPSLVSAILCSCWLVACCCPSRCLVRVTSDNPLATVSGDLGCLEHPSFRVELPSLFDFF